jgi:HPt (histidine-containing phosphotransfer) domain-containing protein
VSAAVNLDNLRNMTGGDIEMERELFNAFLDSSDECLEFLRVNCGNGAEEAWRRRAHAWKGISLNLGAEQLGNLCKNAQEHSTASVEEKLQMLVELQKEYDKVRLHLQACAYENAVKP